MKRKLNVSIIAVLAVALWACSKEETYVPYSPKTPVVLLDGDDNAFIDFIRAEQSRTGRKCAVICYDGEEKLIGEKNVITIGAKDDLASHGKHLFTSLRVADTFGCEIIYAHLPPKTGVGLALYNRCIRAAAHTVEKIN